MRHSKQYELDFNKTLPYFLDHIGCGKTLSEKLVKKIDFSSGSFFTILPDNAHLDRMFEFSYGGIIPLILSNQQYSIKGGAEVFVPSKVVTMDGECSEFIAGYMQNNEKNCAIMENYMADVNSIHSKISNVRTLLYDDELYYLLTKENSVEEIYKALRKSKEVWHSLTILTVIIDKTQSKFDDFLIEQVCSHTKFVIAGAYDGEGYIFWEKML